MGGRLLDALPALEALARDVKLRFEIRAVIHDGVKRVRRVCIRRRCVIRMLNEDCQQTVKPQGRGTEELLRRKSGEMKEETEAAVICL